MATITAPARSVLRELHGTTPRFARYTPTNGQHPGLRIGFGADGYLFAFPAEEISGARFGERQYAVYQVTVGGGLLWEVREATGTRHTIGRYSETRQGAVATARQVVAKEREAEAAQVASKRAAAGYGTAGEDPSSPPATPPAKGTTVPPLIGECGADGRYPVHVHGSSKPTGYVWKMGRGDRSWYSQGASGRYAEASADPIGVSTRWQAAQRLASLVDVRDMVAAETERRERLCTTAPDGWRFATWDEIEASSEDESEASDPVVRLVHHAPPIYEADGPLYPETFSRPVELWGINRLDNGCIIARGRQEGVPGPYVLLMLPRHAELGALVPAT